MERKYSKRLLPTARMLRRGMTPEEKHLWYDFLRSYPVRFARQKMLGRYIADFYCSRAKLVIELDGSGHDTVEGIAYDEERTHFLEGYGLRVVRIRNSEINHNFNNICDYIDDIVKSSLRPRHRFFSVAWRREGDILFRCKVSEVTSCNLASPVQGEQEENATGWRFLKAKSSAQEAKGEGCALTRGDYATGQVSKKLHPGAFSPCYPVAGHDSPYPSFAKLTKASPV